MNKIKKLPAISGWDKFITIKVSLGMDVLTKEGFVTSEVYYSNLLKEGYLIYLNGNIYGLESAIKNYQDYYNDSLNTKCNNPLARELTNLNDLKMVEIKLELIKKGILSKNLIKTVENLFIIPAHIQNYI